ncbi:MAG: nucleotidyltransferase domain-containing protein, partial [Lachnospiraceae bacterium]|nr:nucleotidyltransferase domain-containing protein [Lachnospiraceae bacterium]
TSDIDISIMVVVRNFDLKEEIERIPTLKKIDVFEYDQCRNSYLKEDMDCYGRKIY